MLSALVGLFRRRKPVEPTLWHRLVAVHMVNASR